MTDIWIIHCGAAGDISESVVLKTNNKAKVGKYIRKNIEKFMFIFQQYSVCSRSGKIRKDLSGLYGKNKEYDLYNKDDYPNIIPIIRAILENYTDSEIVDELWAFSRDSEADYAAIAKINSDQIITL